jgi:hypothetical protein
MVKKYNIESNIDFYSELYKSLDNDDDDNENIDNDVCLITNTKLTEHYVTLDCGHKFNYVPLYHDVRNHKSKFNGMEGNKNMTKINEIRCPYCREKQNRILPYHHHFGLEKIHGVNVFNKPNMINVYNLKTCEYICANPKFDPNGNNPIETSKLAADNCKYILCKHIGYKSYDYTDYHNYAVEHNLDIEKCYCFMHMKQIIKTHQKNMKLKEKEEIKKNKEEAKQKIKEEKQKIKEEKQKIKEEKQKIKEELKKTLILSKLNKEKNNKQNNNDDVNTVTINEIP